MELKGFPQRIEAFRRGDRALLAELYRAHVTAVESLIRGGFTFISQGQPVRFRGFHTPSQLQETTQDCFLRAFRHEARHAYDGERAWRPYLLMIARNQVIDQLRRDRTAERYLVPLQDAVPGARSEQDALSRLPNADAQDASPEVLAMRQQLSNVLTSFLDELDPEDQQVVQLHLVGELTQEQLASHLNASRNDVRKRIRELRARLLRHLKTSGLIADLDISELLGVLAILLGVTGEPS